MTVAYVLSMKSGLPSFNRDELLELENRKIPFILYATKIGAGPYTPSRDWKVRGPNPADTLIGLFGFFTRYPRRFGRALSETVREFLWAEFLVAAAFAWDMRRHGVTWIHAHFGDRKVLVARLASILLACPYSVTIHAHELTSMYQRRARSRALRESVRVFTVADFNRESLIRDWALSPSKVVTNRLILGRDHQRADRRAKMLVVANFVEKKGYDVLVQALREIPASEITVWIVGGGELDVEALAKTAEVMDRVVFLGCVAPEMLSILLDACDWGHGKAFRSRLQRRWLTASRSLHPSMQEFRKSYPKSWSRRGIRGRSPPGSGKCSIVASNGLRWDSEIVRSL